MKRVLKAKLVDEKNRIYEVQFENPFLNGKIVTRRMNQDEMTCANKQTSLLLRLKGIIPEAQYESVIREISECLDLEGSICWSNGINQAVEAQNG